MNNLNLIHTSTLEFNGKSYTVKVFEGMETCKAQLFNDNNEPSGNAVYMYDNPLSMLPENEIIDTLIGWIKSINEDWLRRVKLRNN